VEPGHPLKTSLLRRVRIRFSISYEIGSVGRRRPSPAALTAGSQSSHSGLTVDHDPSSDVCHAAQTALLHRAIAGDLDGRSSGAGHLRPLRGGIRRLPEALAKSPDPSRGPADRRSYGQDHAGTLNATVPSQEGRSGSAGRVGGPDAGRGTVRLGRGPGSARGAGSIPGPSGWTQGAVEGVSVRAGPGLGGRRGNARPHRRRRASCRPASRPRGVRLRRRGRPARPAAGVGSPRADGL
jgi:hypothetical protein